MKILLINKFYHTAARSGGVGRYLFELQKLLVQKGHQVMPFAVRDTDVVANPYLKYFPAAEDYSHVSFKLSKLRSAVKYLHNGEAATKLEQLIKAERPDIAHIHNVYHHLTSAIFKPLRRHRIPVVMTVHDYKLICPNQALFTRGQRCQRCRPHRYYNCVRYRCVKNSYAASILAAMGAYFNQLGRSYQKNIAVYIAPSQFMKNMLVKFGFEKNKITVLPYALDSAAYRPEYLPGDYFLYFGRLSPEKGISDLLLAVAKIKREFHLKIIGQGPSEPSLRKQIHALGLECQVELLGFKSGEELKNIIRRSSFVVVPSRWYDNAPLAISEAMLLGKSVIGPAHGGIPEMIKEGVSGSLYQSNDINDLAEKMTLFLAHPQLVPVMGRAARKTAEQRTDPAGHISQLETLYQSVLYDKLHR